VSCRGCAIPGLAGEQASQQPTFQPALASLLLPLLREAGVCGSNPPCPAGLCNAQAGRRAGQSEADVSASTREPATATATAWGCRRLRLEAAVSRPGCTVRVPAGVDAW